MEFETALRYLGAGASLVLPLFNIPLMMKILKTRSTRGISHLWAVGVWSSILLMTPAALMSPDWIFSFFAIVNLLSFSGVLYVVIKYRHS